MSTGPGQVPSGLPVGDLPLHLPPTVDLDPPASALAVCAHPDDAEFGAGATLAKWAAAGSHLHHLVLSDGSKGTWDPLADRAQLVALRRHEQLQAATALGGGDVTFFDWVDGELDASLDRRRAVCEVIRRVRPTVVLGHDPWRRYRLHPDHRHAGWLVVDGVVAARDATYFPDLGLDPWRPDALLLWEPDEPDHVENATGFVGHKLAALAAHRSQLRSTMGIDEPGDDPSGEAIGELEGKVRRQLSMHGALAGLDAGEAFRLLPTR